MSGFSVDDRVLVPLGDAQMTAISAAVGLASIPTGARYAWLQAETQNVRARFAGGDPTASVGMLISKDGDGIWCTSNLNLVLVIQAVAGAILNITYYR